MNDYAKFMLEIDNETFLLIMVKIGIQPPSCCPICWFISFHKAGYPNLVPPPKLTFLRRAYERKANEDSPDWKKDAIHNMKPSGC